MINPKTGEPIVKGKPLIMMYALTSSQMQHINNLYANDYEIADVSQCFTDVLAVNAAIIFLNPHKLSTDDFDAIEEMFSDDEDTAIVFTDDVDYNFSMAYHVENDLENTERSWTNMYDKVEEERAYKQALENKKRTLEEIDGLISGDSLNLIRTRSKIATIGNNSILYSYITKIIKYLNSLPPNEKVEFRAKINKELRDILKKRKID